MSTRRRLDVVTRLRGEFGQRLEILSWWQDAFEHLDDPGTRELLISLTRQSGKSQLLASLAVSELFTVPAAYVVLVSASESQAGAIFNRKIKKPLASLLRDLNIPAKSVVLTKRGVEIPSTSSMLEVVPSIAATTPGRSPTLLIFDEARDIADDVYSALAPSVIGAGGKIVVASSAGRPAGFFYELLKNPTPETWIYQSAENDNPHADRGVLSFLRRRLALLAPAAGRRELHNEFSEDGESFLVSALIDAAIDDDLTEMSTSGLPAYCFIDLSRKKDLTSRVVVVRATARRPEAADHLIVASIRVWNPQESPTREVDFAEVREDLASLPQRFPQLQKVLVDEGAEAGSVLPFAKSHPSLSLLVEGFNGNVESNLSIWSSLSARLHGRTLSIPRLDRLIAELRGLRQESFAYGSRFRIVDGNRRYHRDVSLALAGATFAAGAGKHFDAIDPWIISANRAAPPTGASTGLGGAAYGGDGAPGVDGLERSAFGYGGGGGVFSLGKDAFGDGD